MPKNLITAQASPFSTYHQIRFENYCAQTAAYITYNVRIAVHRTSLLLKFHLYNYTVCTHIIPLPIILQVCIPGLHISLGIFDKLYSLLENACERVDLEAAQNQTSGVERSEAFASYSDAVRRRAELQYQDQLLKKIIKDANGCITYLSLTLPDSDTNQKVSEAREWLSGYCKKALEVVGYKRNRTPTSLFSFRFLRKKKYSNSQKKSLKSLIPQKGHFIQPCHRPSMSSM